MSGLFNNVQLGFDDLLSPGHSNPFEDPGSWLMDSSFTKNECSLPCENDKLEGVVLKDVNKNGIQREATKDHLIGSISNNEPADALIDCGQYLLPQTDFESNSVVTFDDLIIFSSNVSLPPAILSEAPSPNPFENIFYLNSGINLGAQEIKDVPEFYLPDATAEDIKVSCESVEPFKGVDFHILNEFLCADQLESIVEIHSFNSPDHTYSVSQVEKTDFKKSQIDFNSTAETFVENDDFPSTFGEVKNNESGIVSSSSLETINLDSIDFKMIEQIMAGNGQTLDSEIAELLSEQMNKSKTGGSKSKFDKKQIKSSHPKLKEALKLSDDELMEEGEENEKGENLKKYLERRRKNNIASRRSRAIRKSKLSELELKAIALETENKRLKEKISKMEAITAHMKETLIARLRKS